MKIEPVRFNYGAFMDDQRMSTDNVTYEGRKNLLLQNERFSLFGEVIDKEGRVMYAKDIALKRGYAKDSKQDILDAWESYLCQFADDEPQEITDKREKNEERERNRIERERKLAERREERDRKEPTSEDDSQAS